MLTATGISKRYGLTLALDGVDFAALPGEIHALVGENGAGKSTLINILAGRTAPDGGRIELDGTALLDGSSATALRRGVAAVFQTPMLFERLTWEENLALGAASQGSVGLELSDVKAQAYVRASELDFTLPPPGVRVADCSIATQVRLEILRALSFNPRVLILDEPTGVLAPAELTAFLAMIRGLRTAGRIVIIVTHKLAEALAVADRITVLRAGRKVAELPTAETGEHELARLMIGELPPAGVGHRSPRPTGAIAFELENIVYEAGGRRVLDNLSLHLVPGEIVGIAGVEGNGQAELAAILSGAIVPQAGRIDIAEGGAVAVIPQNRDREGLILEMMLWENLLLAAPLRKRFASRAGMLRRRRAMEFCAELLARFAIRSAGPAVTAAALSGGNRQRLTVARAFASAPCAIVAHDVCRGLDLRAVAEVH
ncbi:MAG TPA: ATP-binding cassette domain-containing protein, partial [Candidatus Binataceae bacterium]|nr:ATP-binding cassette domain-containing protein [Candidatus Binataceae bacterium]